MAGAGAGADDTRRIGPPFSPPSRLPHTKHLHGKHVPKQLRKFVVCAVVSSMIQSIIWIALCTCGLLVYNGYIAVPDWRPGPGSGGSGSSGGSPQQATIEQYPLLLANLYFKESPMPALPAEGLLTPSDMYLWMEIMVTGNTFWLFASVGTFAAVRLSSTNAGCFWVYNWALVTGAQAVLDVTLGALMVRDLVVLLQWGGLDDFPAASPALLLCPATVLVAALRCGVLLLINVVLMLRATRRTAALRDQIKRAERDREGERLQQRFRHPAAEREEAIDAYLYRNRGDSLGVGVVNAAFEPDEQRWSSFRPTEESQSQRPQPDAVALPRARVSTASVSGDSHSRPAPRDHLHDYQAHPRAESHLRRATLDHGGYGVPQRVMRGRSTKDDDDDFSHLAWMEEVDKYVTVNVHVRKADSRSSQAGGPPAHQQQPHAYYSQHLPHQQPQPQPQGPGQQGWGHQHPPLPPVHIPEPDYTPPPQRAQKWKR